MQSNTQNCIICGARVKNKYTLSFGAETFECADCRLSFMQPQNCAEDSYNDSYYYFANYSKSAIFDDICKGARIAGYLKKYFPNCSSVFDMGAAAGILLNKLKCCGWQVSGIEISEAGVKLASQLFNIKLKQGDIENYSDRIDADVVIMTDALEHSYNPEKVLNNLGNLIESNCGLIIETPNYGSFYRKITGCNWVGFNKFHNYQFTIESLVKLARKNNFELIDSFTENFNLLSLEGIWRLGIKDKIKKIKESLIKKQTEKINSRQKNNSIERFKLTAREKIFFNVMRTLKSTVNFPLNYPARRFMMGDQLWLILRKK